MRQLATPAGIDHDYNFLSAIERDVERSDRRIVEERKLVGRRELVQGVGGEGGRRGGEGAARGGEGDQKVRKEVLRMGVRVERLPRGMARQKRNATSWSRKQRCVVWQVEWVREKGSTQEPAQVEGAASLMGEWPIGEGLTDTESSGRRVPSLDTTHSKILTTTPLGDAYAALLEEQRRAAMTPEEKSREKKRRAQEIAENEAKKPKLSASAAVAESAEGRLSQDRDHEKSPEKADVEAATKARDDADTNVAALEASKPPDYSFYLYRPHTPSNLPIVLIPLRHDLPLDNQLQGKVIVEYPTIYVFPASQSELPEGFMLQDDFFKKKGIGKSVKPRGVGDAEIDSGSESDEEDEGSGSEGEIGLDDEDGQAGGRGGVEGGGEVESDTSSSGTSDEEEEEEEEGSDRSQEFEGLDHTP